MDSLRVVLLWGKIFFSEVGRVENSLPPALQGRLFFYPIFFRGGVRVESSGRRDPAKETYCRFLLRILLLASS
jgi:hypothetical protein